MRYVVRFLPIVLALVVLGGALAFGMGDAEPPVIPSRVELLASAPGNALVTGAWKSSGSGSQTSFQVADAIGEKVHLFESPDVPLWSKWEMTNPTWEGLPLVFAVIERHGSWLHVRVSSRPNNMTAWVSTEEVQIHTVPNHVLVEVAKRQVTVFHGDEVLLRDTVAVGTAETPTPVGAFFVDGIVDVGYDTGPYGAFQVSVSGFSDALQSFGGGIGQIALHGTNHPELLGQPVSNGCVRMSNETITKLAQLAPLGTPVNIVA